MGWLGWTEAQTLATSMPAIVLAREGRGEMIQTTLEMIFGKPPPMEEKPEILISDDAVRSIFMHLGGPKPNTSP